MNIITNGQWKEFVWQVLILIDSKGDRIEIPSIETLDKVAEDAQHFLEIEYPNMDPSGVKIAGSLAYYFNGLRPAFYTTESVQNMKKKYKNYNEETERIKLNAVIALALARTIVTYSYQKIGTQSLTYNPATIQEWHRLLVKRHYTENSFSKIECLSHFGMIMMLSKYLDGCFPGRNQPW